MLPLYNHSTHEYQNFTPMNAKLQKIIKEKKNKQKKVNAMGEKRKNPTIHKQILWSTVHFSRLHNNFLSMILVLAA